MVSKVGKNIKSGQISEGVPVQVQPVPVQANIMQPIPVQVQGVPVHVSPKCPDCVVFV